MSTLQENNLKKVLGFWDILGFVIGNTLGAGVLIMTGIGIGLTGKGIVIAFLVAGIMNCICVIPMIQLSSAIPTTGAGYRYSTLLLNPKLGALWQCGVIFSKVTLGLYALSFAQYLQAIYPNIPIKLSALIMLTFFYLLNLVGIKSAASTQKLLVILKISGLLTFVAWGITSVDIKSFSNFDAILPNGTDGMLQAIGLVAFASYGGVQASELGGEMKNPSRDLPWAIILGTIISTLIYMAISFVAAGTLPIEEIANKPLNIVGKAVMSTGAYYYFIMAGVVIGLGTMLNSVFQWVTKGLISSSEDGWVPKKLGEVNTRFGTPHYALTFFYILGAITILSGIPLEHIARMGFIFLLLVSITPVFGCYTLLKRFPDKYEKSKFKLSAKTLLIVTTIAIIFMFGQVFYLLKGLPYYLLLLVVFLFIIALIYVNIRAKSLDLKKIANRKI